MFFSVLLRLRDISEETAIPPSQPRRRSNSLPIPQIEISMYQGPNSSNRDSPSIGSINKDYIEIPEPPISALLIDSPYHAPKPSSDEQSTPTAERKGSEKKRRVKMADLRTLIESRILSKSDRGLEKIGLEVTGNGKRLQHIVGLTEIWSGINYSEFSVLTGLPSQPRHRRKTIVSVIIDDFPCAFDKSCQRKKHAKS